MCMIVDLIQIYLFVFSLLVWVKVYLFFNTFLTKDLFSCSFCNKQWLRLPRTVNCVVIGGKLNFHYASFVFHQLQCPDLRGILHRHRSPLRVRCWVTFELPCAPQIVNISMITIHFFMFDTADECNEFSVALLHYFSSKMSNDQISMPELQRKHSWGCPESSPHHL